MLKWSFIYLYYLPSQSIKTYELIENKLIDFEWICEYMAILFD